MFRLPTTAALLLLTVVSAPAQHPKLGPGEYASFVTAKGTFIAQLYPDAAPQAVANFVALAEGKRAYKDPVTGGLSMAKLYDGLLFFRTVPGDLIQTGDPLNNGTGQLGYTIPFEKNNLKFDRAGRMGLAQSEGDPTSRGAEIFFALRPMPNLNGDFLVIGQIVQGLDVAEALSQGPRKGGAQDVPEYPDILEHVTVETIK